jgi:hypothetical protein
MEQVATLALPLPREEGPDALDRLLARAPSADPHFGDAVTRALRDLGPYGDQGRTAFGHRVLTLLDSGRLRALAGSDGSTCEAHAAKLLLDLGYPWALHLTPQQLKAVRDLPDPARQRPGHSAFLVSAVASGLNALPLFTGWMRWIADGSGVGNLLPLLALCAAAVNVMFVSGHLARRQTAMIAVIAGILSWFGYALTERFDAAMWGCLTACWAMTWVATKLGRTPNER